jgi:hypothetical protein
MGAGMGYTLEAVIAPIGLLAAAVDGLPDATVVDLVQGFGLLPMTDGLFDAVDDGGRADDLLGFWKLPSGFDAMLREWSADGFVAFVEADFFGGTGSQRAAVWLAGRMVVGPVSFDDDFGRRDLTGPSPISQVLAYMGVTKDGHRDEFAAVGLDRHRCTESWLGYKN